MRNREAYETIRFERVEEAIGVITLNRPECLNAMSMTLVEELHACLTAREIDLETRVVILTGAGRGFCSGTDLKAGREGAEPSPAERYRSQKLIGDTVLHMRRIPQPIIGAINGVAAGGGFSFSMACDIRVAAASAKFICSFINVGLTAGDVGSSYFLPRLIGLSRANELLYTGRAVDAAEAERIGYVSRMVPDGQALEAALAIARTILEKSPFGIRLTKEIVNTAIDAPSLESALHLENRSQTLAVQTGDFREAIEAFQQKRAPKFPPEK